jgi:hypothetical protein
MNSYYAEFHARDQIRTWHREAQEARRLRPMAEADSHPRRRLIAVGLGRVLAGVRRTVSHRRAVGAGVGSGCGQPESQNRRRDATQIR